MGFFSALKKLWGTDHTATDTANEEAGSAAAQHADRDGTTADTENLSSGSSVSALTETAATTEEAARQEELALSTVVETRESAYSAALPGEETVPCAAHAADPSGEAAAHQESTERTSTEALAGQEPVESAAEEAVTGAVQKASAAPAMSEDTVVDMTFAAPAPVAVDAVGQQGSDAETASAHDPQKRGFFARLLGLGADAATAPAASVDPEEGSVAPSNPDAGVFQAELALRLREAEPRLSVWLGIILEGIQEAGNPLWERLRFLLQSLEAPEAEISAFLEDFRAWLERMEYRRVEEFRSELQYRLALALDLEDEEDERSRLFLKLSEGLARTREQLSRRLDSLFSSHGALDEDFWEELEELFIMADMGYEPATRLSKRLRERARAAGVTEAAGVRELLRVALEEVFRMPRRISAVNPPEVILMIGVNGAGKTTTTAKLAHRARMQGKKVLIAAADTFRAGAIEQLRIWAERVGADFHAKAPGSDPAAVAYEAVERARAGGYDVLFVDTAGRLQTKVNLMEELAKIRSVLGKKHPGSPHRSILVLDATTGQNALSQARLFREKAGIDEVILTKLDGTAKGGVAVAVAMQFAVPITFIGLGEKLEDLRPFNGGDFATALLGRERTEADQEGASPAL